jgi:hypothetical protein
VPSTKTTAAAAPARQVFARSSSGLSVRYLISPEPSFPGACGPVFARSLETTAGKPGFTPTIEGTSPALDPGPGQVVVVDAGTADTYRSYAVLRVGPGISHVAVATSPTLIADEMDPVDGWAAFVWGGSVDVAQLQITATNRSSPSRFFLRDRGSPCTSSPQGTPTPPCTDGQYSVSIEPNPGAGSTTFDTTVTPTGTSSCVLSAHVTGRWERVDGRPDGPPATGDISWILPARVSWQAGHICFNHDEVFAVQIGSAHAKLTFPGGGCAPGEVSSGPASVGPPSVSTA